MAVADDGCAVIVRLIVALAGAVGHDGDEADSGCGASGDLSGDLGERRRTARTGLGTQAVTLVRALLEQRTLDEAQVRAIWEREVVLHPTPDADRSGEKFQA